MKMNMRFSGRQRLIAGVFGAGSLLGVWVSGLDARGQESKAEPDQPAPSLPLPAIEPPPLPLERPVESRVRIETPTPRQIIPRSSIRRTLPRSIDSSRASVTRPATVNPADQLTWDSMLREHTAQPGEKETEFTFKATNETAAPIVVTNIRTSCGCTVARMPNLPWEFAPGAEGSLPVTLNFAGKRGTITKSITVTSSAGIQRLLVRVDIPMENDGTLPTGMRSENLKIAAADRQAVFKGECADCHVKPTIGKMGRELYDTACGICHDAEHRAVMVTDLTARKHVLNEDYWRYWIAIGRPNSLMPAFSKLAGGPLTDAQVESLVEFLSAPKATTARTPVVQTRVTRGTPQPPAPREE